MKVAFSKQMQHKINCFKAYLQVVLFVLYKCGTHNEIKTN